MGYFRWHTGSVITVHGLGCPAACGILAPWPEIESRDWPASEGGFFTTRPPRKPLNYCFITVNAGEAVIKMTRFPHTTHYTESPHQSASHPTWDILDTWGQGRPSRCPSTWGITGTPWRRKWQPTPVCLPGESHGQRSLAGYSPRGCKELDMTWAHKHDTFCLFYLAPFLKSLSFLRYTQIFMSAAIWWFRKSLKYYL